MKIKNRRWHKKRYLEKRESKKNKNDFIVIAPSFPKPELYDTDDDFIDSFRMMFLIHKQKISLSPTI